MSNKIMVFILIFCGYATYTANRRGVAYVSPDLMKAGFERKSVGFVLTLQNFAYLLSKFFGGLLSDRLSPRLLFASGLVVSGLASFLFSLADNGFIFSICWFINGLAQGVGWPAIAKLLKNWFDPIQLGTWWSLASTSSNFAGVVTPFFAQKIIREQGWRNYLALIGVFSAAVGVSCWLFMEDKPLTPPRSRYSRSRSRSGSSSSSRSRVPPGRTFNYMHLLQQPYLWCIAICYLSISIVKTALTDWAIMFLVTERGKTKFQANTFLSAIEFGGIWGGITSGVVSDGIMNFSNLRFGHPRMIMATVLNFMTAIGMHLFYTASAEDLTLTYMNAIGVTLGLSIYGQIALYGIVATETVVPELSGSAHAIAALFANIGSMLAGFPFASLASKDSWSGAYGILALASTTHAVYMITTIRMKYEFDPNVRDPFERQVTQSSGNRRDDDGDNDEERRRKNLSDTKSDTCEVKKVESRKVK